MWSSARDTKTFGTTAQACQKSTQSASLRNFLDVCFSFPFLILDQHQRSLMFTPSQYFREGSDISASEFGDYAPLVNSTALYIPSPFARFFPFLFSFFFPTYRQQVSPLGPRIPPSRSWCLDSGLYLQDQHLQGLAFEDPATNCLLGDSWVGFHRSLGTYQYHNHTSS